MDRGANKEWVYDGSCILSAPPNRLFIDAKSTQEWRDRDYFPERAKKLMAVMDRINVQYAPLFFAGEGINQAWKMQRNLKSPAYTTRWQELPRVWLR